MTFLMGQAGRSCIVTKEENGEVGLEDVSPETIHERQVAARRKLEGTLCGGCVNAMHAMKDNGRKLVVCCMTPSAPRPAEIVNGSLCATFVPVVIGRLKVTKVGTGR